MRRSSILLLLFLLTGCSEATYRGKPVAFWAEQLRQDDPQARDQASLALGKIGKPAVPALRDALGEPNPAVRLAAARALAKMYRDAADALPELIPLLQDPDTSIQAAAARAIGHMDLLGAAAAPALIPLLSSPDADCRLAAADAVGRLATEAEAAVPELCKLLKDPNVKVRRMAARQVGNTLAPKAIPALIAALGDEDTEVRQYAGFSLRKIDPHVGAHFGYW